MVGKRLESAAPKTGRTDQLLVSCYAEQMVELHSLRAAAVLTISDRPNRQPVARGGVSERRCDEPAAPKAWSGRPSTAVFCHTRTAPR